MTVVRRPHMGLAWTTAFSKFKQFGTVLLSILVLSLLSNVFYSNQYLSSEKNEEILSLKDRDPSSIVHYFNNDNNQTGRSIPCQPVSDISLLGEKSAKLNVALPARPIQCAPIPTSAWPPEWVPQIAWLMSYPNSGTTYTLQLVQQAGQTLMGSVYQRESTGIPIFEDQPKGPYWLYGEQEFRLPSNYVLTKTHCQPSGFSGTDPHERLHHITPEDFSNRCVFTSSSNKRVKRAIHLFRDPFSTVVARYHFMVKRGAKKFGPLTKAWSRSGFRNFCKVVTNYRLFWKERNSVLFEDKVVWNLLRDVPCRSEFVQLVHWHNNAMETSANLGLDTMIIHYDQYKNKSTANDLFQFLQLDDIPGSIPPFILGKTYLDFFTPQERANVREAVQRLATNATCVELARYF